MGALAYFDYILVSCLFIFDLTEFFPACWSTRNDCPCSVQDRFEKCKSTEFAADADVPEDMTAAVSIFFFFRFHEKKNEFLFIYFSE